MRDLKCPNCDRPVNEDGAGCVLHALIQCVRERGDTEEEHLQNIHAVCDVDSLWERLGDIVDDLEEGNFNTEEA